MTGEKGGRRGNLFFLLGCLLFEKCFTNSVFGICTSLCHAWVYAVWTCIWADIGERTDTIPFGKCNVSALSLVPFVAFVSGLCFFDCVTQLHYCCHCKYPLHWILSMLTKIKNLFRESLIYFYIKINCRNFYYLSFENSSVIEYDVITCHCVFVDSRVMQIPLRSNGNLEYFKELGSFKIWLLRCL